jgi:hypothetical protein
MKQEMEYHEKMYTVKGNKMFTSRQMAEMQQIGIKKLNEQLKKTTDPKKIKILKNRLREIKLWLLVHPDVLQFCPK